MVDPEYLVGLFHGISQSINGWLKGNPICIAHGSKIYPVPGKHLILGEEGSKHVETHPVANITLIRIPLFWCKTKGTVLIGFRSFQTVCSKLIGFWSSVSILCVHLYGSFQIARQLWAGHFLTLKRWKFQCGLSLSGSTPLEAPDQHKMRP